MSCRPCTSCSAILALLSAALWDHLCPSPSRRAGKTQPHWLACSSQNNQPQMAPAAPTGRRLHTSGDNAALLVTGHSPAGCVQSRACRPRRPQPTAIQRSLRPRRQPCVWADGHDDRPHPHTGIHYPANRPETAAQIPDQSNESELP